MDNDNSAWILLIVLIVSASLLIALKLTRFINDFGRRKRYFLIKMCRANDYKEYCNWRRELRCLYLCLIPFITECNVKKVYPVFFRQAKHAAKEKRSDGLMHILAPSMLAICICAICLCGASWAWFTASTSTGTTAIQSSSYKLVYQVNEDAESHRNGRRNRLLQYNGRQRNLLHRADFCRRHIYFYRKGSQRHNYHSHPQMGNLLRHCHNSR